MEMQLFESTPYRLDKRRGMPHMYVLVISKDANFRRLVTANLVIRGHLAVGVSSLNEAARLVSNAKPQLVVFSHTGPLPDGQLRALREAENLEDVPLVVISTETPDSALLAKWDVDDYVVPYDVQDMVERMSPWLSS